MTKTHAATATRLKRALVLALGVVGMTLQPAAADWKTPWKDDDRAIVIDAYEFNPIDWNKMASDDRIAGFINKASDGMPPQYRCGSKRDDAWKLCTNRWWKYSVTKELYMTRRQMADSMGLLWGAYHLARPGNPREQADHFIDFAEPRENDLIALDIEDLSDEFMSLEDATIFSEQIKIRTGRYPVLYTNGNTAKYIADNRDEYPLLARLPVWYARYTNDITGKFPEENWPAYALWQFSSMHNCNSRSCPYRVGGTKDDIDVNVSHLDKDGLKAAWPFAELFHAPEAEPEIDPSVLVASTDAAKQATIADAGETGARTRETADGLLAAYGTDSAPTKRIDPLELLKTVASKQQKPAESRVKVQLQEARDAAAAIGGDEAPGMPIPTPNPLRASSEAGDADATVTDAEEGSDAAIQEAREVFGPALPEGIHDSAEDEVSSIETKPARLKDAQTTAVAALSPADMRIDAAFSLSN